LALRPVRLACLIHAANVHSEPGSNPSKESGTRTRQGRTNPVLMPEWVEDFKLVAGRSCRPKPARPCYRLVSPLPPPMHSNRDAPKRQNVLTPAPLKGPLTTFTTIDRFVKEPRPPTPPAGAILPREGKSHRPTRSIDHVSAAGAVLVVRHRACWPV